MHHERMRELDRINQLFHMKTEFQVKWKRVGQKPKARTFKTRKGATAFLALLGPEPWVYFGRKPTDRVCCSGYECACGGQTVQSESDEKRASFPVMEWIATSVRSVSEWVEESRNTSPDCGPSDGELRPQPSVPIKFETTAF